MTWVQNSRTDVYTSVASRLAVVAIRDPETMVLLGGEVQRYEVEEVDLACGAACSSQVWEEKIQVGAAVSETRDSVAVIFTDGSRGEDGKVAGGWFSRQDLSSGENSWARGRCEIVEKWRGWQRHWREDLGVQGVLILADSKATIQAVKKAGKARTRGS